MVTACPWMSPLLCYVHSGWDDVKRWCRLKGGGVKNNKAALYTSTHCSKRWFFSYSRQQTLNQIMSHPSLAQVSNYRSTSAQRLNSSLCLVTVSLDQTFQPIPMGWSFAKWQEVDFVAQSSIDQTGTFQSGLCGLKWLFWSLVYNTFWSDDGTVGICRNKTNKQKRPTH